MSHNCGVSVDVSRGVLANDTKGGFHPYHLLTLPKDDKVWEKEDFVRWKRDFCYLGYVVALYIRAGSLASAQTSSTSDASAEAWLRPLLFTFGSSWTTIISASELVPM